MPVLLGAPRGYNACDGRYIAGLIDPYDSKFSIGQSHVCTQFDDVRSFEQSCGGKEGSSFSRQKLGLNAYGIGGASEIYDKCGSLKRNESRECAGF